METDEAKLTHCNNLGVFQDTRKAYANAAGAGMSVLEFKPADK